MSKRWQKAILATSFVSLALGLFVLIGWHARIAAFVQMHPDLAPMQYNTALCFILSGAALYAFAYRKQRFTLITGLIISTLAGLTVIEYLFDFSLGLDLFFFHSHPGASLPLPGRMSPISAVCFLQVGHALTLIGFKSATRLRPLALGLLGSVVVALCATAISGYVTGLEGTYALGQLSPIALHTAIGLGILGLGILVIGWNEGCQPGERLPRWLPLPVALAIFTASLILWQALDNRQTRQIAQTINGNTADARNQIVALMNARIESLVRMAQRWEFSAGTPRPAWEADAQNYVDGFPGFQAIEWVDRSYRIRWAVPLKDNELVLNRDLTQEGRRQAAVEAARTRRETTLTQPIQLYQGGPGFLAYVPVFFGTNFNGFIVGVFRSQELFDALLPANIAAGNSITLRNGNEIIYERAPSPPPGEQQWTRSATIRLPGITWKLLVWPTPKLVAKLSSSLPVAVLAIGCLSSGLFALMIYLAQTAGAKKRALASVNRELRQEMEVRKKIEQEMERLIHALEEALAHVKTLSGLLPICARCKKIRDDKGYWSQIETYITRHSSASFTHGLCPDCAVKTLKEAGIEVPASSFQSGKPPDQA
jgi:sensor domain CHASE-containing protein